METRDSLNNKELLLLRDTASQLMGYNLYSAENLFTNLNITKKLRVGNIMAAV